MTIALIIGQKQGRKKFRPTPNPSIPRPVVGHSELIVHPANSRTGRHVVFSKVSGPTRVNRETAIVYPVCTSIRLF
jgi:hypothetical protein